MKTLIDNMTSATTETIERVTELSKQMAVDFKNYLTSDACEEDLDEVIAFLYILKPLQSRNFTAIKNRKLRIAMKTKFVLSQARLLVGASAAIGAEVGLAFGGPQGAIVGATAGTATGALIISFAAGRVLVKRMSGNPSFATIG